MMQKLCASALAVVLLAQHAAAQSIAERVAKAPDGTVRMTFSTRPDVCGHGDQNITTRRGSSVNQGKDWSSLDIERDQYCEEGPGRVVLTVASGKVTRVKTYVGGRWRERTNVTDLGAVPAPAAGAYLLHLAETGDTRVARDAIFPATLVDSVEVATSLLRIARDERRPLETRRQAVFWVSQAASDSATKGLAALTEESGVNREVREQAVFALSQRPKDEGVPALIRVARTNKDPEVRRKAIFWLGQSDDPRALALFEELILKR